MRDACKTVLANILILPVLLVSSAGCGGVPPQSEGAGIRGEGGPAGRIKARVGEEFVITLDSNPTTGYRWEFTKPLDEGIVTLVDSKYEAPQTRRRGAGGRQVWTFKAAGKGRTVISLKYIRPWEKDTPPAKEHAVAVIVH